MFRVLADTIKVAVTSAVLVELQKNLDFNKDWSKRSLDRGAGMQTGRYRTVSALPTFAYFWYK
ncbi:hypothetical protein ANN_18855 [Periplaneta americana]|uniref:Uncharacterized protein n=1 Tax=Periplaneta americana TaxID=6978 RepID=A0ABQ8SPY3_PERAM|nr:hypothetical protein ANN_18855 [Periplaneta americana]